MQKVTQIQKPEKEHMTVLCGPVPLWLQGRCQACTLLSVQMEMCSCQQPWC